ncbi:hypothetical protein HMPREF0620_0507 [Parascardovia denticolens DSM 10105 = JCM 12538]|uniref:Uncharacterized protein n=1 Tax=Parascardovia denticolens DSM 10105 = JCM 12538 TaxID=864564 RepID=E6K121_PARDN|nr:hypothetical protein HMPREF0620_0507 [Parascardovia denticolens DSM 10105 = JCM 12538]
MLFQSTLPLRGATSKAFHFLLSGHISIHAPLAGSDGCPSSIIYDNTNFNPRSPCGERHNIVMQLFAFYEFQSTLPLRGATADKTD